MRNRKDEEEEEDVPLVREGDALPPPAAAMVGAMLQHFLNFLPLPHGQGLLGLGLAGMVEMPR